MLHINVSTLRVARAPGQPIRETWKNGNKIHGLMHLNETINIFCFLIFPIIHTTHTQQTYIYNFIQNYLE